MTIGKLATLALQQGKSAKDTLDMVKRVFPGCNTTMKSIYFYASKAGVRLAKHSVADQGQLKAALAELSGGAKKAKVA